MTMRVFSRGLAILAAAAGTGAVWAVPPVPPPPTPATPPRWPHPPHVAGVDTTETTRPASDTATTEPADEKSEANAFFQQMRDEHSMLPECRLPSSGTETADAHAADFNTSPTTRPATPTATLLSTLFRFRLDPAVTRVHRPPPSMQVVSRLADTGGDTRLTLPPSAPRGEESGRKEEGTYTLARIMVDRTASDTNPGVSHQLPGGESALPVTPNTFKLSISSFDRSTFAMTQTEVFFQYDLATLQVTRESEDADQTFSVQLIQVSRIISDSDPGEEPLRLMIRGTDKQSGDTKTDLKLAAADFPSMRRKYPAEVNRYLRPIFADLGQLSPLFSADPQTAWQVLAGRLPPDPAMTARVTALLPRLDADDFPQRQAAQRELASLGQPGAIAVRQLDRRGLSPQQHSELDAFLASVSTLTPKEARQLATSPEFLLDCLELDELRLRQAAWTSLVELAHPASVFNPNAGPETRAAQVQALRGELTRSAPSVPQGKD